MEVIGEVFGQFAIKGTPSILGIGTDDGNRFRFDGNTGMKFKTDTKYGYVFLGN